MPVEIHQLKQKGGGQVRRGQRQEGMQGGELVKFESGSELSSFFKFETLKLASPVNVLHFPKCIHTLQMVLPEMYTLWWWLCKSPLAESSLSKEVEGG